MTFATEQDRLGKDPLIVVGLVVDKCSLTAGVAPCTATETGDAKCYNTRATCNDVPNYDLTTTEIKFCDPRSNLPIGEAFIPALSGKVKKAPTSTTAGKGLGNRAVVQVRIKDFPHHDRGIDPYFDERTYDAETTGTFWGKFLARNPYYEGRTLKVYYGYIGDTFSWGDFEIQEYDITDIDGPTKEMVNITAKDVLIRTYDNKSQYPVLSTGVLSADIAQGAATATLLPSGVGDSEYPASGTCAIGSEAKTFTRSGDVLTFTAHAQWGTEADSHSEDDTVQVCVTVAGDNVVDFLEELLVTGAGLPAAYIPYADGGGPNENWDDEKELWLAGASVNGILMKPESINNVIEELSEQFMFDIWWNAVDQEVQIKALSPEASGVTINTLTDGYSILADTMRIKRDEKQRYTEIQVWYDKLDYSEKDDTTNFRAARISADASRAGADRYDGNSIKVILARWINSLSQASQLSGRYLSRFSDTPEIITFEVAPKDYDQFEMAGRVEVDSWQFQDFSGANDPRAFQVTQIVEKEAGHSYQVTAFTSSFVGNYFFFAPAGTPDYTSATDEQKASYGYFVDAAEEYSDGEPGDKII